MPVEDLHPQYENKQYEFRQMRDTIDGVSSIKRAGTLYLPMPTAMFNSEGKQPPTGVSTDNNDLKDNLVSIISNAPWNHNNPAYSSFIQRARFPDITSLLLSGLTGIAMKKGPETKLPASIAYLEESATMSGLNLEELFFFCVQEVLSVGRISLLLEIDPKRNKFFINTYSAESFINWVGTTSGLDKSTEVAKLAVFQEVCPDPATEEDEFSNDVVNCQIVLRNEATVFNEKEEANEQVMVYNVQKYVDSKAEGDPKIPTLRGQPFPIVPMVTINADGLGLAVGNCPLIGVSDIAISIYQKDADMSNSEFLTCNPMLVTTGISDELDSNGQPTGKTGFPVGSNITINLPDDGDAFYVEPTSTCLGHMVARKKDLMDEAAQYGAAILTGEKKAAEAAETVKMRQSGQSSSLRTIIKTCAEGIQQLLQYAYMWDKKSEKESTELDFDPNLDLTEASLSPQHITALLQAVLNRKLSNQSFLKNLKTGGVEMVGETIEDELALIETQKPDLID